MSVLRGGEGGEPRKQWQDDRQVFISQAARCSSLTPTVCGSTSNRCVTAAIPTITERLTPARSLYWMYIITREHQPRQDPQKTWKKHTHKHTRVAHAQICWIGSDLSDLAASTAVALLNAAVSSLPSSKHSFAILSKASLMPPITGGLQAGRFGARRLGRSVCYASGPFNRAVICCCLLLLLLLVVKPPAPAHQWKTTLFMVKRMQH